MHLWLRSRLEGIQFVIGSIPVGAGTMVLGCFLLSMEAEGKCAEVSAEWFGRWLKGWEGGRGDETGEGQQEEREGDEDRW